MLAGWSFSWTPLTRLKIAASAVIARNFPCRIVGTFVRAAIPAVGMKTPRSMFSGLVKSVGRQAPRWRGSPKKLRRFSGGRVFTRFYQNLLGKRGDGAPPLSKTEALREAQRWLRNLSKGERDRLAGLLARGRRRGEEVAKTDKPIAATEKEPRDRPYAHPRYWSAFILIGDPD